MYRRSVMVQGEERDCLPAHLEYLLMHLEKLQMQDELYRFTTLQPLRQNNGAISHNLSFSLSVPFT